MISLDQPLDLNDPQAAAFLAGIQGNILKSHARNYANHILLEFGSDTPSIRAWIAEFASTRVTSGLRQSAHTAMWKLSGKKLNTTFVGLLLAFEGYQALDVPGTQIPVDQNGSYFKNSMKVPGERKFNDPPVDEWQPEFQQPIHMLIILANDNQLILEAETQALVHQLRPLAKRVWVEPGVRLRKRFPDQPDPVTVIHFGFQDGVSDPQAILQDAQKERAARGWDQWDPAAPLSLLLLAEPGASDHYGSFMVFRKLEQHVRAFDHALVELAATLGEPNTDHAGAMAVGRFRDGRPIIPPSQVDGNNFTYKVSDPDGKICPFQAHVRKTNPRGDSPLGVEGERAFRIARRAISYGERPDYTEDTSLPPPESGVGLLFQAFQSSLDNFAIQQEGADSNDFAQPGVGVDAVYGTNSVPTPQHWPAGSAATFTMANFINLRGGEYFFAPSMSFLLGLGQEQ